MKLKYWWLKKDTCSCYALAHKVVFFWCKTMKIHILSIHTWFWSAWNVLSIRYIVIDWYCTDTKQHIWDTFIPDDETSNIIEDNKIFVVFIDCKYIT